MSAYKVLVRGVSGILDCILLILGQRASVTTENVEIALRDGTEHVVILDVLCGLRVECLGAAQKSAGSRKVFPSYKLA